ncbi:uncharacterized protein BT62DRAFT_937473 [Guyanagaster necrorhizus]|uniref:Uncharacterized protein n=1 Tax=Guyanagaster necrorhizus TaxID=856835 RepID=A0A9P7VIA3_9AGAR|nr:uncharacterized protein BT62DRAFT_937473 [Guyanagaster necrorhizus MCA 3950]KAG7441042.1 hypothetical protein BT62DRAFT_937473 [Guyanagaster necrorhizus MCA 3950]
MSLEKMVGMDGVKEGALSFQMMGVATRQNLLASMLKTTTDMGSSYNPAAARHTLQPPPPMYGKDIDDEEPHVEVSDTCPACSPEWRPRCLIPNILLFFVGRALVAPADSHSILRRRRRRRRRRRGAVYPFIAKHSRLRMAYPPHAPGTSLITALSSKSKEYSRNGEKQICCGAVSFDPPLDSDRLFLLLALLSGRTTNRTDGYT